MNFNQILIKNMFKGLTGIMLSIFCGLNAQINMNNDLSEHLIRFKPFLGRQFIGEFNDPSNNRKMKEVITWKRILNGKAVKITNSINNDEYGGETIIMWEQNSNSLRSWYFDTSGSLIESIMEFKENKLISIQDVQNNNGITKVKTIMELAYGKELKKRTKFLMNNMWVDGLEVRYQENSYFKP